MHGAGMRDFLDFGRAAGRARNQLLGRLFPEVLVAGKPALEAVVFLTDEIIYDHRNSYGTE
jgi:hypothetical protein